MVVRMNTADIHRRLDMLADRGLTVSICYGESGDHGRIYSVDVLTPELRSFTAPFGAETLEQAIEIAELEGPKLIAEEHNDVA